MKSLHNKRNSPHVENPFQLLDDEFLADQDFSKNGENLLAELEQTARFKAEDALRVDDAEKEALSKANRPKKMPEFLERKEEKRSRVALKGRPKAEVWSTRRPARPLVEYGRGIVVHAEGSLDPVDNTLVDAPKSTKKLPRPDFDAGRIVLKDEGGFEFVAGAPVKAKPTYQDKLRMGHERKIAQGAAHRTARQEHFAALHVEKQSAAFLEKQKISTEAYKIATELLKSKRFEVFETSASWILKNHGQKMRTIANPKVMEDLRPRAKVWNQDMKYHGKQVNKKIDHRVFSPLFGLQYRMKSVFDLESLDECLAGVRNPRLKKALKFLYDQWDQEISTGHPNMERLNRIAKEFNRTGQASQPATQREPVKRFVINQGQQMSVPNGVPMNATVAGIPTKIVVENPLAGLEMDDLLAIFGGENYVAKLFVNLVCMTTSLMECSSTLNVVAQLVSFVNNNFSTTLAGALVKFVKAKIGAFRTVNQGDSLDVGPEVASAMKAHLAPPEMWAKLLNGMDFTAAMGSELGQAIWQVLSVVSISAVAMTIGLGGDIGSAMSLRKKMEQFTTGKDGVETMLQRLLRLLRVFCEKTVESFRRGDLSAFFEGYSTTDWLKTSETVLSDMTIRLDDARPGIRSTFGKNLADGVYPPRILQQLTVESRILLIEQLVAEHPMHAAKLAGAPDIALSRTLEDMLRRLTTEEWSLKNTKVSGEVRVEPFAVFCWGPPGSGKSMFSEDFHKICARKRNLPDGTDSKFQYVRGTNFWDGVTGSQWCVILDDIDQGIGIPTLSDVTHVELAINVINRKPLMLEQASVEKKGTLYCNYQAVCYCTNYKNALLRTTSKDPRAFWRRFPMSIGFIVKPEYSGATGILDLDKLDGSRDYWNFKVGTLDWKKYDPANAFDCFPYNEVTVSTYSGLCRLVSDGFEAKLNREHKVLMTRVDDRGPHCEYCGLTERFHSKQKCVVTVNQAGTTDSPWFGVLVVVGLWYGMGFWMFLLAGLTFAASFGLDFLGFTTYDFGIVVKRELGILWLSKTQTTKSTMIRYLSSVSQLTVDQYARREALWFGVLKKKVLENKILFGSLTAASIALVVIASKWKRSTIVENQGFVMDGTVLEDNSVGSKKMMFTRVPIVRDPLAKGALSTSSAEDVLRAVSTRFVDLYNEDTDNSMLGVQIFGNVIMCPGHLLVKKEQKFNMVLEEIRAVELYESTIRITKGTLVYVMKVALGINAVRLQGRECVLIRVPGLPALASSEFDLHLPVTSQAAVRPTYDRCWLVTRRNGEVATLESTRGGVVVTTGLAHIRAYGIPSRGGDCGGLYVAQIGKMVFIAGYHVSANALRTDKTIYIEYSVGEEITETELRAGFEQLKEIGVEASPNIFLSTMQANRNY